MSANLFHLGEEYIQKRSGERVMALRNQGIITREITPGTAGFILQQEVFFAASIDAQGMPWASLISGDTGFLEVYTQHLFMNPVHLLSKREDIFWENVRVSPGTGLLFIDLLSRRRFRLNGQIAQDGGRWRLLIDQAYPNCPKYIQRRQLLTDTGPSPALIHDLRDWLDSADTIFVASADLEGNIDLSHRGGDTGFVKYLDEHTLRIPDYAGNSMFNTLGNFHVNPSAGILIVDFKSGETLHLAGKAELHFNEGPPNVNTGGTNRFWDFKIEQTVFSRSLLNFTSRFLDFSPLNP